MVICLKRGADCLHVFQLMPLHAIHSIFIAIYLRVTPIVFFSVTKYYGSTAADSVKLCSQHKLN